MFDGFLNLLNLKSDDSILAAQFTGCKAIESGEFSTVFKAKHRLDGKTYAVKKLKLDRMEKQLSEGAFFTEQDKRVEAEVKTLTKLNTEFVLKYYNSWTQEQHLYVFTEYCKQTLAEVLNEKHEAFGRQPTEPMESIEYFISCEIFRELLECLQYIHGLYPPVIHRNIKPNNIYISYDNKNSRFIKLGDFGLATDYEHRANTQSDPNGKYMAPEVRDGSHYSIKADVYSVGCVAADLFDINTVKLVAYKSAELLNKYSTIYNEIHKMIETDPSVRPTSTEVLNGYNKWCIDKSVIIDNKDFESTKDKLNEKQKFLFAYLLLQVWGKSDVQG